MAFNKRLKELRMKNDMTQKYVAAQLNVARSTIAGYETKCRQPSQENLAALANLFHVSIDYLLDAENAIQASPSRNGILDTEERALLLRYSKLSGRSKKDLFEYIDLLELRDGA